MKDKSIDILNLLKKLDAVLTKSGYKVVVTGGLGIAGAVSKLYRDFNDLDITVIGNSPINVGVNILRNQIVQMDGVITSENPVYFQCTLDGHQIDILYVREVATNDRMSVAYETSKTIINGSKRLLNPIRGTVAGFSFFVFRPELAVAEKLVGSVTLRRIRERDVQDLRQVIRTLDPRLLFDAVNIKFRYTNNNFDNTGF